MKATIFCNGDPSVGINGSEATVDMPYDDSLFEEPEVREGIRQTLKEAFAEIWDDGSTAVLFSDQCPDCWEKMTNNECLGKTED